MMMILNVAQILLYIGAAACFILALILFMNKLKPLARKYKVVRDAMLTDEPPIDWLDRLTLNFEAMEEAWYLIS